MRYLDAYTLTDSQNDVCARTPMEKAAPCLSLSPEELRAFLDRPSLQPIPQDDPGEPFDLLTAVPLDGFMTSQPIHTDK